MKIVLLVTGFASHVVWAEGYARACRRRHEHPIDVRVVVIPGDRWKFRMLCGGAEMSQYVEDDDDVVVIDGMIEMTVLFSALQARAAMAASSSTDSVATARPKVLVYLHENQITTPFVSDDRDVKAQRQWQYAMSHYRSLLVADGFIFNSHKHCLDFQRELPKVINEQSPRDVAQWHLETCKRLLQDKCFVLPYGLELHDLQSLVPTSEQKSDCASSASQQHVLPTILWNARLEEDKDPGTFLEILKQVRDRRQRRYQHQLRGQSSSSIRLPFQLIVLGTDPSKDQTWYRRFREQHGDEILFIGFCNDRTEYSSWLSKAHIVVSTAQHETFGISIVESVYLGAIPLLPQRLSYPEIFSPHECELSFYDTTTDAVNRLLDLMDIVEEHSTKYDKVKQSAWDCAARYDWSRLGAVYDECFQDIAKGDTMTGIGSKVECNINELDGGQQRQSLGDMSDVQLHKSHHCCPILITDPNDERVQLYRPKSLRDHGLFNDQMIAHRNNGIDPSIHGGRRTMVRMMEAIEDGSESVLPLSFLTNQDLCSKIFEPQMENFDCPVYVAETQELLNIIRGQKLNSGDSVLAVVSFPRSSTLAEIIAHPPILILEDVRNAENVGSILRTAFCLGVTSVVASPTAWSAIKDTRAARCSMGTIYYHRFYKSGEDLADTIQQIQELGRITVYGVEISDQAIPVKPHGADKRWAAVMGNEDAGLTSDVATVCDHVVFIPQAHGDSLNVGHAAAITLFELGRENPTPIHDGKAWCA